MSAGVVDRLARAICRGDDDQRLFEAAIAIAQNCLARRAIKEQQVAVIERLRDKTAIALAKGDNSFNLGKARFLEIWIADKAIEARVPKLIEKYNVELPPRKYADSIASGWVWPTYRDPTSDDLVPLELKVLLEEPDSDRRATTGARHRRQSPQTQERNDHEALKEASRT